MRFTAGVIVGVLIARPATEVVKKRLTPPVRRKIAFKLHSIAGRLHTYASNSPYLQAEQDR